MNDPQDRPIDFSSVDPTADPERFDQLVEAVIAQAADELAARRMQANPVLQIAAWRRPMLAAAAVVAVIAGTVLTQVRVPESISTPETDGIAEAVGIPVELAQWLWDGTVPSTTDLFGVFEE
jgi:heme/copper-type cytochrome/quinol oxidase subunit 2